MNKKNIYFIIYILLITAGIILRFKNLQNTQFTWDQENIVAYAARNIVIGRHLTLIGGKASVGNLYLAPLYSYIAALVFAVFRMDPVAGAILSGLISAFTILIGYKLLKSIFSFELAMYFAVTASVSTFIMSLDRIPWNVNLIPLSSLLVICGLLKATENKKITGWILVGLGLFLGINSQFSVFLFISIIAVYSLMNKKIIDKSIFIAILFFILGMLPVLIFSLRHNSELNPADNFLASGAIVKFSYIFARIRKISLVIFETLGRIFIYDGFSWVQQLLGIIFTVSLLLINKNSKIKSCISLFFIYLFIYFTGFSVYGKSVSEYYFIGILPAAITCFAIILDEITKHYAKANILFIMMLVVILARSNTLIQTNDSQSLGLKKELVLKIKEESKGKPVSVVYDMDLGWSYGYGYLFDYYGVKVVDREHTDKIFWLSYPQKKFPGKYDFAIGDFALGLPDTTRNILDSKNVELYENLFRLRVPKNWPILRCQSFDFDKYLITPDMNASCNVFDTEKNGLAVYNIPQCNIWEIPQRTEYKIGSLLPFYVIDGSHMNIPNLSGQLITLSFERNRCIGFVDLGGSSDGSLTPAVLSILKSAQK